MNVRLAIANIPAILATISYEIWLGHRHDYSGHFLSGYAATFGMMMVAFRTIPPEKYVHRATQLILPLCFLAILLGTLTEATFFRLAKFDEIDWCNQSLGAVLAGVTASAYISTEKLPDQEFDYGLINALFLLFVGGILAFA